MPATVLTATTGAWPRGRGARPLALAQISEGLEVVHRVGEREPEALAHAHGRERGVLLARRGEERE